MAKRRKHGRRRHRTGNIIATRRLNGLGSLKQPASFTGAVVPPLAGGALTGGTTLALEHVGGVPATMQQYAPAIGLGAGAAAALAMVYLVGKPQALASFTASAMVAGTLFLKKYLETPSAKGLGRGYHDMGAIVAEQMRGLPAGGVGAIVMEPYGQQGYGNQGGGERVSLGSINSKAFGTPGFEM